MRDDDLLLYSIEHVLAQTASAPKRLGFYELRFYSAEGRPSRRRTGAVETFYYYPSGGTLRDRAMNIVFYEAKLDQYRSFGSSTREGGSRSLTEPDPD
jgi:hypothetical protein